jgi:biopolymer transport protein ExbD
MNISRHLRPKEASFDLTPMVDVIFLLIIFFTLTSQFTSTTHTPLDLPEERGEPDAPKETHELVIDLDRDGNVKVLGQSYDLATLGTFLAGREFAVEGQTVEEGVEQPVDVVIRADRACTTASLNALAEVLMRVGVRRWSLATSHEGGA